MIVCGNSQLLAGKADNRDLNGPKCKSVAAGRPIASKKFPKQQQQLIKTTANNNPLPISTWTQTEREYAGKVELEISYLAKNGSLIVHVIRCAQLRPVGKRLKVANP